MLISKSDGSARHTVVLNPNLREKRNFGGKDSSGQWVGEDIVSGVHSAMKELYKEMPSFAEKLNSVGLDLTLTREKWWLGSSEPAALVAGRIEEVLSQALACPRGNSIRAFSVELATMIESSKFGHRLFIDDFIALRFVRSNECSLSAADGSTLDVNQLDSKKLSNAGTRRISE
ncbi:MAG: hypothetical protein SGPRY_002665 [Prymnesium sp.]